MPYLPTLSPTTLLHHHLPHLATLLSTPTGLDATLATTCYASLFLHTQLHSLKPAPTKPTLTSPTAPTRLQTLYTTLESHRILTRLFSLPSLLSHLLKTHRTQHRDPAIKTLLYAGLVSGLVFQVLENFALLVQAGVVRGEKAKRWEGWCWVVSNRLWLAQLVCEMGRLGRSWQMGWKEEFGAEEVVVQGGGGKGEEVWGEKVVAIDDGARTQELVQASARELVRVQSKELEKRWWRELYVTACSIPLAVHWSFADGESPVSEALFAGSGLVAGVVALQDAWEETA